MKKFFVLLSTLLILITVSPTYASQIVNLNQNKIGDINYYYDNAQMPPVLIGGKTIKVAANFNENVCFSFAIYRNEKLESINCFDGKNINFTEMIPKDLTGCIAKIMIWEMDITPKTKSIEILDTLYPLDYNYDNNNRLLSIAFGDNTVNFIYDNNGNLLSKNLNYQTTLITNLALTNVVTAPPQYSITYTSNNTRITIYNLGILPMQYVGGHQ